MNVDEFLDSELEQVDNLDNDVDITDEQDSTKLEEEKVEELKQSLASQVKESIGLISEAIGKGNVLASIDLYENLVLLSKEVPENNISFRNKVNDELVNLHTKIQGRLDDLKKDYDSNVDVLTELGVQFNSLISTKDLKGCQDLYKQIYGLYKSLPDEFFEKKITVHKDVLGYRVSLNTLQFEVLEDNYTVLRSRIVDLISEMDSKLAEKDNDSVLKLYEDAEVLYRQMPKGFLEDKVVLFNELLKKKNTAELLLQIGILQNELDEKGVQVGSAPKISSSEDFSLNSPNSNSGVDTKPMQDISDELISEENMSLPNLPELPSSFNSEDTTEVFSDLDSSLDSNPNPEVDSEVKPGDELDFEPDMESESDSETNLDSDNNYDSKIDDSFGESLELDDSQKMSAIDVAVRDIKIARAKIDLLDGNLRNARKILFELLNDYPEDELVKSLELELKHALGGLVEGNASLDDRVAERKLARVQRDLEHDLDSADRDYKDFSRTSASKRLPTGLKRKLRGEVSDAIIERRIGLARKNIEEGNVLLARKHALKVIEKYPDNEEARHLLELTE